jgi:hypothetical protein
MPRVLNFPAKKPKKKKEKKGPKILMEFFLPAQ